MLSSKLTSFLFLITFVLCSQNVFAAYERVGHACVSSENFTSNDPYDTNMKELLSYLVYETPSTGFGMGSKGEGQNRAYGSALCRADVPQVNCTDCLVQAINDIGSLCWPNKGAVAWYKYCQLKYSSSDHFGVIDHSNWHVNYGAENVSEPTSFSQKTTNLLSSLAEEASMSSKMSAIGNVELYGSEKLYGLVQCTRDLSSMACKECLTRSISALPNCCSGKKSVRIYGGSCDIRHVAL
ncbi:Cysteine-rich repeat secretory protein [Quillaja saponaria]|uniref:Cysteine-rich repeat secretory protein n=1 Tax=Quillaja saponaria TaxID=32244 RepID=A0AAD7QGX7_QUISA|nr:Cysteine-rich repeat secretory protein [Quillaja saponaria]